MRIYDVQVNHLTNPLGYRMERVTFSWKVACAQGKYPESARVLITADAEQTAVLLDTGFDPAADRLCFEVELSLEPRKRYFYQIFQRSDAGEEAASELCWFETGMREEPWLAKWISCDKEEPRHPIFEKEITPCKEVTAARLYACGLGLYEASYAGVRIGDEYLTPYSNNYDRWIQYQTYDVTDLVKGPGKLSFLLGNGWYKARFGFACQGDTGYYGDEWKLIAQLHLQYADGSEEIICTDESWQVRRSNLTYSSLYDGEHRDDTLPQLPVEKAVLCQPPKGSLTDRMSTPVTVHETFTPAALIRTPKDELVLDLGQEITGSFALKVNVPRGQLVRIQTGEILQEGCFYNANLRSAKSEYRYISGGEPTVVQPYFTYYGYRYVKIEGIPELKPEDFTGLALYSQIPQRGHMETGHDLVNKLLSNIRWGMKGNFLDVPTDCPQRDERMGWTGDAQVFSPTATYLHDTYSFYAKYLYDMYQEQLEHDGLVPNVIPSAGSVDCTCAWSDAACIIPWNVYRFYGDKSILKDQFASMKAWVDFLTRLDGEDHAWRRHFHFGDWLALDNMNGDQEQSFGATDVGYLANIHYAVSAELVAMAAQALGDLENHKKYIALARQQFDEVRKEYFSATGRPCINTQTAYLLALKYDLSDNRELVCELLRQRFEKTGGKLETGFIGTPILCDVLVDNGMEQLAWGLLLNEDYPGWLREIKLGATTVWERWNSVLDNGLLSGINMNSLNHYAYGSIGQWLFARVAGLTFTEPGCTHAELRPMLNWKLRRQHTVYDSPSGKYESSWELEDPCHVCLTVTVPFGCSATLVLPDCPDVSVHTLEPGTHSFRYETNRDLRCGIGLDTTLNQLWKNIEAWQSVSRVMPVDSVPREFWDLTLAQLLEKFQEHISPEQLQQAYALLESLRME